jgi:hypothetical protein
VNTVMTIKTENFLASAATVSFSRREFFHWTSQYIGNASWKRLHYYHYYCAKLAIILWPVKCVHATQFLCFVVVDLIVLLSWNFVTWTQWIILIHIGHVKLPLRHLRLKCIPILKVLMEVILKFYVTLKVRFVKALWENSVRTCNAMWITNSLLA